MAASAILTPKVGCGFADELKRAWFWVRMVLDKPQDADVLLRNYMVDIVYKRRFGCLVVVSDDSDFVEVFQEAMLRCLKRVVVGDMSDGVLKRIANAFFSWSDLLMGK
ncbi:hypothetical protein AB3S75_043084 [Citrus x aurantiifolia]